MFVFDDHKTPAVVLSSSVKNFEPEHADDFSKTNPYQVSWQDGEGSFDGFFAATIKCQAASLEELQVKAEDLGVKKMPPSFYRLLELKKKAKYVTDSGSDHSSRGRRIGKRPPQYIPQMKQNTSKNVKPAQIKRKKENEPAVAAKKKRMRETLNQLRAELPCQASHTKTENEAKSDEGENQEDTMFNSGRISPDKDVAPQLPNKAKSEAPGSPLSTGSSDSQSYFNVEDALNKIELQAESNEISEKKEISKTSRPEPTLFRSRRRSSDCSDNEYDSGSDDSTSKLMDSITKLKEELTQKDKKVEVLQVSLQEKQREIAEQKKELEKLRMAGKVSECCRKNAVAELEKLKTSESYLKNLKEENRKLKSLISSAASLLLSGSQKFSSSSSDVHPLAVRQLDFSTKGASPFKPSGSASFTSPHSSSSSCSQNFLSPSPDSNAFPVKKLDFSNKRASPMTPLTSFSASSHEPTTQSSSLIDFNKKKKKEGKKSKTEMDSIKLEGGGEVLTKEEMQRITDRVLNDLSGKEKLPVNSNGQIEIGGGIFLTESQWEKGVKKQTKASLFIKKLGHAIYGHEGLKMRTVGIPLDSEKHAATPSKVDAVVACYRAKLLHTSPNITNLNELSFQARELLAQKMQDEARKRADKAEKTATVKHQRNSATKAAESEGEDITTE